MDESILLKQAINYFDVRQYEQAFSLFKKLEKKSDMTAIYYLGIMYYEGKGIKTDYKEAFRLFSKAAIELHTGSIYMLGLCHEEGKAIDLNLKQAFEYYQTALHQGSIEAELKIAYLYEEGKGVEKNPALSLQTYVELAKKDNAFAMYKIGMAYFLGKGVRKSIESAHSWLNKALLKGSVEAMNQFRFLGTKSSTDLRTSKDILRIGIDLFESERPTEALIYFETAAKENEPSSYRYLDKMYYEGLGVAQSYETSFDYIQKAVKANDIEAFLELGKRYELGLGTPSSFTKAAFWYEEASKKGNEAAKQELLGIRGYSI